MRGPGCRPALCPRRRGVLLRSLLPARAGAGAARRNPGGGRAGESPGGGPRPAGARNRAAFPAGRLPHAELARRSVPDAPEHLRQVYWGALLHDIGKIGISDAILLKQGPLTDSEWQEMRAHPEMGYRIVAQVPGMREAADIVRCHEERFDGSGYPRGLGGEAIPWGARLFAVIDTLDAMTSDRPYRQALSFDAAKAEILRMSGSQFDPRAVGVFLEAEPVLREMVSLKCGTAAADEILGELRKGE